MTKAKKKSKAKASKVKSPQGTECQSCHAKRVSGNVCQGCGCLQDTKEEPTDNGTD